MPNSSRRPGSKFLESVILLALLATPSTKALSCDDAETISSIGREFLTENQSYAAAKKSAIEDAVLGAMQTVNPTGYSRITAGTYSSESSSGSFSGSIALDEKLFQRVRGMTKSVTVTEERILSQGGFKILEVEVSAEICLTNTDEQEIVVAIGDIFWVNGQPSHTLRRDVIRNFPVTKRTILIGERTRSSYSDVSISGVVEKIYFRSILKSKENFASGFFSGAGSTATTVNYGQRIPPGTKEFLEIVAKVRMTARILSNHRILQTKKKMVTEMPVTDDPTWQKRRHHEASKMIQFAFKLAGRDIVKKLEAVE